MLKYGENMYQFPAVLLGMDSDDRLSIHNFKQVAGDTPCFTNLADLDCILETLCKLRLSLMMNGILKPFVAIAAKHGNACGIGVSLKEPSEAINSALWGNAKAIWGGEVIVNFPLSNSLARILKGPSISLGTSSQRKWMLHLIAAPAIDNSAIKILSDNPQRKLFMNNDLFSPYLRRDKCVIRSLRGGFMSQPPADFILDFKKVDWTNTKKSKLHDISLLIAWSAAFTSFHGGNEIAIAKDGALLGVGGGPATFDAVNTAVARVKEQGKDMSGAVFGADAFFPFIDVPEILFKTGCIGGTVPAGGNRGKDVIKYFKEHRMFVGMIPAKYRGFCRH